MEEEKAEKTLEVEKLEKKVQEAEEYQQHMEQEQSDGQVALLSFSWVGFPPVLTRVDDIGIPLVSMTRR